MLAWATKDIMSRSIVLEMPTYWKKILLAFFQKEQVLKVVSSRNIRFHRMPHHNTVANQVSTTKLSSNDISASATNLTAVITEM